MTASVFTSISSDRIARATTTAQHRVVLAAPSVFNNIAIAMVDTASRIGKHNITIVLDCDEEVFRLGYGDFDAVKLLSDSGLQVRQAPGLRFGVFICDDKAWVFSPTALYVQPEIHSDETPNAIQLQGDDVQRLISSIVPQQADDLHSDKIEIGQGTLRPTDLRKTEQSLEIAPPVPFDIARQVRVFQPYIQYVDLHLTGCSIERHVVKIPHDIFGNELSEEVEQRLKTSFNLINKNSNLSSASLNGDLKKIRDTYIKSLGKKWGNVILKSRRTDFDKEIDQLRAKVTEHQISVQQKLQAEIDKSKEQIIEAFWKNIQKNPPKDLLGQILESEPTEENAKQWLRLKINACFPSASQIVGKMELECQFKDVTFETLNTDGFADALKVAFPLVPWDKPFDDFKAAKEKK